MRKKIQQLNTLQNVILLGFLLTLAYFLLYSSVFGQAVGVGGYVPKTPENTKPQITQPDPRINNSQQKENKWLYFFQKGLEEQENPTVVEVETVYDKVASWGIMVAIMMVAGFILVMLLRWGEKIIKKVG